MRSKSKSRKWTCRFSLPIVKGVSQYGSNQGQLPHKANAPASLLLIEMSKHRLRLQSLQFLQHAKSFSSFYCNQQFDFRRITRRQCPNKYRLRLKRQMLFYLSSVYNVQMPFRKEYINMCTVWAPLLAKYVREIKYLSHIMCPRFENFSCAKSLHL